MITNSMSQIEKWHHPDFTRVKANVLEIVELLGNPAVRQFDSFFQSHFERLNREHPTGIPNDFRA
jgi:hypothetical protein